MWNRLPATGFGVMASLDELVSRLPLGSSDALRRSDTLIVTSDYSGHHKGATHEVYSLLITGSAGWNRWERERIRIRDSTELGMRRMSFKGLNDSRKRAALVPFLDAANLLPGVCVSVLAPKSTVSLFQSKGSVDMTKPEFAPYSRFKPAVFERMLRVVHLVSFFVAGLSRSGQDVLWFTDADDIAANDARVADLTNCWATVLSNYLQHNLRHVRCGTTRCDNGTLQVEDLASIPDLAAGSLGEMLTLCKHEGVLPTEGLLVPLPGTASRKCRLIGSWLADRCSQLDRMVFVFDEAPTGGLAVKQLDLHAL
jgi:hypothetical protein